MSFPTDAAQCLGRFSGLRYEGDRIFKSEDRQDPDFRALPPEVQDALTVIGRVATGVPVAKEAPALAVPVVGTKAKA